jgi:nicotinate-nucleotide adenylyltransferase
MMNSAFVWLDLGIFIFILNVYHALDTYGKIRHIMMSMLHPCPHSGPSLARMRIGLLGGSFNPAHAGHLEMSLHALKRLGLDQVWWLVSPQNPLKPATGMAATQDRLKGARSLAQHPKIIVTDIETQLGTRYTADALRELRRRFPSAHFVWLMGADNLEQFPRWRRWAEIMRHVPVAVFRRPGYDTAIRGKAAIRFAKFRHRAGFGKKLARTKPPAWLVLDNRLNLVSSTALRQVAKR